MKRILFVVAIAGAFAVSACASLIDVTVFGGYTTVSMAGINSEVNSIYDELSPVSAMLNSMGVSNSLKKTDFTNGLIVGANVGLDLPAGLALNFRPEYVAPGDASTTFSDNAGDSLKFDISASLVPIMLGVSYICTVANVGLGGGIYGGYGIANSTLKLTSAGSMGDSDSSLATSGNGFVGEVDADARYSFVPMLSLGLQVGYRMADISQMTANADNANFGVKKGDVLKDQNDKVIPFDFSGVIAAITLNFSF